MREGIRKVQAGFRLPTWLLSVIDQEMSGKDRSRTDTVVRLLIAGIGRERVMETLASNLERDIREHNYSALAETATAISWMKSEIPRDGGGRE